MSDNNLPVSVIIINYNTRSFLDNSLRALFLSALLPEQVIVVDNNSSDGSAEMVKRKFPQVILFQNKENLGFAKANNLALSVIEQPYIWLLNSDTEIGRDSLKELYDHMESDPEVGAIGPQLVYPDGSLQSVGGYFPTVCNIFSYLLPVTYLFPASIKRKLKSIALYPQGLPKDGLELDYVTGAAMFLRKSALDQCGLLGEDYFMYFEETDLCWRMKKDGWKVKAIQTDPVMHIYGGSFKGKYDKDRLRIFLESLKIFVKKNYKGIGKFIILLEIVIFGQLSLWIKGLKK